ncbi:probable bifunctional dTTP/UTP pyrophosphatase/methyltransferase protein [Aotus nancymaae]|uniref:probable bifunctional dTTP/UTP pyrophosphatase/methyltransferase protein n=1 Tax=Aotus nancymaae TaxID=37293 RepID=UPI0030FF0D95
MVLCPVIWKLLHKRVVLASASPRRQEILSNAGLRFEVVPSRFKEKLDKASFTTPYGYAMETAKQKALEVAHRMHQKDLRAPDVVIGADTIVAMGRLILEKPVDKQDAYRMLSQLSGREHSVFTGVAIVQCSSRGNRGPGIGVSTHTGTLEGPWPDKAGGYGIQALGGMLVESVHGDFLNVVGFPLNHFCRQLMQLYNQARPEDLQRLKHDSIPAVDTFEDLSDMDEGGPEPARRDAGSRPDEAREATADAEGNGTPETLPPFPTRLLELINGFKASKALFTACKLKVFDLLKDQAPQKAADIASKADASVCGMERLLDVCAALGLLDKSHQGNETLTSGFSLSVLAGGSKSLRDGDLEPRQREEGEPDLVLPTMPATPRAKVPSTDPSTNKERRPGV